MIAAVTLPGLSRMKREGQPIVVVTAYDCTFARLLDDALVDVALVGDSLGMVIQGHDSTLPVTLDEMIYHTRAVARGFRRGVIVADMPFGAFHRGPEATMKQALRLMKRGGCHAVKLEGGVIMAETVAFLTAREVPVVGHVGLTPQSVNRFGGFKVQGREEGDAARIRQDALALAEAGVSALVLEGIPAPLAAEITRQSPVPTIGIGAGGGCDGQVLVLHDLLGLYGDQSPRFVKRYLEGAALTREALARFGDEVRQGSFPGPEHAYGP
ncbi:MAG: 3-methyl-2-oxobutanoate hydroxymethyltransferase [Magnetococcales bacterium]|nr:3-methyl-2-oxobutanoate hydroxymethyltransferase [Magnetococcales bacterium]